MTDGLAWVLVILLLGDLALVVGYVWCFSVVQSTSTSFEPLLRVLSSTLAGRSHALLHSQVCGTYPK
jgi:hypothetical protein